MSKTFNRVLLTVIVSVAASSAFAGPGLGRGTHGHGHGGGGTMPSWWANGSMASKQTKQVPASAVAPSGTTANQSAEREAAAMSPGLTAVNTSGTGQATTSRAAVKDELRRWQRMPVSQDGWRQIGGEAGWTLDGR